MRHTALLTIIIALISQGCAMERTVTPSGDSRPCVANYSSEGTFFTGKQFKTFEDFPALSQATAFDNLVAAITSSGYQVINSNKDNGIISASQTVIMGQGKTVPLNAVIRSNPSGSTRIELIFSLSGGLATSADAVQAEFCKLLASIPRTTPPSASQPPVSQPSVSQPSSPTLPLSPTKEVISRVQVQLKAQGFDPGRPDGEIGAKTREALRRFQNARRLQVTGELDTPTLEALGVR